MGGNEFNEFNELNKFNKQFTISKGNFLTS